MSSADQPKRRRRARFTSPTLDVEITPDAHAAAVKSASGACLIADAIKRQYPNLTGISVDMATIRVTDRDAGLRFTYLTPPTAQHLLLSYDQGWPLAIDRVHVRRAVKIVPIRESSTKRAANRDARRAELEAKVADGTATPHERGTLTRMRRQPKREHGDVRAQVKAGEHGAVVFGGRNLPRGAAHPNLLRGTDRHFGAKLADPGDAFREAVDQAVAERLAEQPSS